MKLYMKNVDIRYSIYDYYILLNTTNNIYKVYSCNIYIV